MLSLHGADDRFKIRFDVIENGSGSFHGIIDEISQNQVPNYVFTLSRRLLRVDQGLPLNSSMVIRSAGGTPFLLGEHGDAEATEGVIFRSYRLFQPSGRYKWERVVRVTDPVTGLLESEGLQEMVPAYIWGSFEPAQREAFDREYHVSTEQAQFITNQPIRRQDRVEGKDVIRVDFRLGLYIATLS